MEQQRPSALVDPFAALTYDASILILARMDLTTLGRMASVCRRWLRLFLDENLWHRLMDREFVASPPGWLARCEPFSPDFLKLKTRQQFRALHFVWQSRVTRAELIEMLVEVGRVPSKERTPDRVAEVLLNALFFHETVGLPARYEYSFRDKRLSELSFPWYTRAIARELWEMMHLLDRKVEEFVSGLETDAASSEGCARLRAHLAREATQDHWWFSRFCEDTATTPARFALVNKWRESGGAGCIMAMFLEDRLSQIDSLGPPSLSPAASEILRTVRSNERKRVYGRMADGL